MLEFSHYWFAIAVIWLQVITLDLLLVFFHIGGTKWSDVFIFQFLRQWGLWLGFLVAFTAMFAAQWYEAMGFLPCYLCWWGRIFLYPQIVLFGIAAWRRDANIALYSIALSVLGAGVSFYHHALQMGWITSSPCVAEGGVDCAARTFFEFDYITFPLMSFSVFAFLIVLMLFQIRRDAS